MRLNSSVLNQAGFPILCTALSYLLGLIFFFFFFQTLTDTIEWVGAH